MESAHQRPLAEKQYAEEINQIISCDRNNKPKNWCMSPKAVLLYITGGKTENGYAISTKYFGQRELVEVAISTLLSDRALLLTGIPGTAKSWLSEHLAAAISGDSGMIVQGTSGLNEDQLRYGWNYAMLIAKGPSEDAIVPSHVMNAMTNGKIVRIEELTRIPSETQDALISLLSEKIISIPEIKTQVHAIPGFNIIATANDQDRGVFEMSAALKRRFNIIRLPLPKTVQQELEIVKYRVKELERILQLALPEIKEKHMEQLVTLFRELREGKTIDGKQKIRPSQSVLSPAEEISILHHARIQSHYFNSDKVEEKQILSGIVNALNQMGSEEISVLQEYNEAVLKKRQDWKNWYQEIKKFE